MAATTSGPAAKPHIARLDVLRALAILGVYFFHMSQAFRQLKITWNGPWADFSNWPPVLYPLVPIAYGWLGVPLFFVLSGFCIHYSTLNRKKPLEIGDFYWRRFLRIYPAYFVCLVGCVVLIVTGVMPTRYFNVWQVVTHLVMIHNFFKMTFGGINGPFWSLAVEMQFYLLYPFLIFVMRKRLSWGGCLAAALVANIVFYVLFSVTSKPYEFYHTRSTFSFPLITWCEWILGAALAEAYVSGARLFSRPNAWLLGSALMLLVSLNFRPLYVQTYLFGAVFFAVVIERYLAVRAPLAWIERALVPIGLISYSFYLWHAPVLALAQDWAHRLHFDQSALEFAAFSAVVSAAIVFPLSWVSYRLCELALPRWIHAMVRRKDAPVGRGATMG